MKRLILTLALASLVLPAAALGKGPSAATMDGPGGGGGITFSGNEGSGPLGDLTQQSGWFAAAFEQVEPNPLLAGRPELKDTLVAAGLPARAPTGSSDGTSFPTLPVSILALALLFISATALLVRRRTRPAAA